MMDIKELLAQSAILYCGIYNIYDKEKRILNKIEKVIDDVFDPLVKQLKENNNKLSDATIDHYCESINKNREKILDNVEKITVLGEDVVAKVRHDISSVGLVYNDDMDNFDSYTDKQRRVVLNFLNATKSNSIKAFKTTYKDKDKYFRGTKECLKNIHDIASSMIDANCVSPLEITMLEKMIVDVNELTQDIIDMGKPKENLLKKLGI